MVKVSRDVLDHAADWFCKQAILDARGRALQIGRPNLACDLRVVAAEHNIIACAEMVEKLCVARMEAA